MSIQDEIQLLKLLVHFDVSPILQVYVGKF